MLFLGDGSVILQGDFGVETAGQHAFVFVDEFRRDTDIA